MKPFVFLIVILLCAQCALEEEMSMNYNTLPKEHQDEGYNIDALVTQLGYNLKVEVIIQLNPETTLIETEDLTVSVTCESGKMYHPKSLPEGGMNLVTSGLANTASGDYMFKLKDENPKTLCISFKEKKHLFELKATELK